MSLAPIRCRHHVCVFRSTESFPSTAARTDRPGEPSIALYRYLIYARRHSERWIIPRAAFEYGTELLRELAVEFATTSAGYRDEVMGRATFELAATLVPVTKAGQSCN